MTSHLEGVHSLAAAYALDGLDEVETRQFEAHLEGCASCREEVDAFRDSATSLAFAVDGPAPPPGLRSRILEQARSERPKVIPLRRRFTLPVLLPAAAVAAVAAIAIGIWAVGLSRELDDAKDELAVLGDPNAQVFETANGEANLVVTPEGEAALVIRRLAPAPKGKDYEIWVFENGVPQRAGLFERPGVARLTRPVEPGQMVAVTVEPDGGVDAPTSTPIFTASSA
jgi:anti-sigma-K factor RskA